jgi:hypothetical protein
VPTVVRPLYNRRCGRVTLLLWSSGGMLLSCATITLSLLGLAPNYVALLGVMAFVSFFEIGTYVILESTQYVFPLLQYDSVA